jgi:hypothetical protein
VHTHRRVVDVTSTLLRKSVVALVVGGALGAGTAAGIGVASAVSDPSPSSTSSPSTTAPSEPGKGPGNTDKTPGHHRGDHRGFPRAHGLLGDRIEHGELTVKGKDGKPVVWVVQHGTVTAASATSVTVKSEDGFTQTYAVNSDTKVRIGRDQKAATDLKPGTEVSVGGQKSGSTVTAKQVFSRAK